MFDGRFRAEAERTLKPVGAAAQAHRHHRRPPHRRSASSWPCGAAVAIGNGALRLGLLLLVLTALPDVLDGAVAKASGTASPRGAFFDSVADRFTDAAAAPRRRLVPRRPPSPGRIAVLPMAVLGASMLISYERAKAEALGYDAKGGLMERAERLIAARLRPAVQPAPDPDPVGHARPHPGHRRPALRQGLEAGQRRGARPRPDASATRARARSRQTDRRVARSTAAPGPPPRRSSARPADPARAPAPGLRGVPRRQRRRPAPARVGRPRPVRRRGGAGSRPAPWPAGARWSRATSAGSAPT